MKYILKSKINDLFFEFLTHKQPAPAIVILTGFPCSNNYDDIMEYFHDQGFNVFFPRYLGTFQSGGIFLEHDPAEDILAFLKHIQTNKAVSLWDMNEISFENTSINICSGSFGTPIATRVAMHFEIAKVLLFSPVVNFKNHNAKNDEQDLQHLTEFVKRAYTNLYRFDFANVQNRMIQLKYDVVDTINERFFIFTYPNDNVTREHHVENAKYRFYPKLTSHGLNLKNLQNVIDIIFNK